MIGLEDPEGAKNKPSLFARLARGTIGLYGEERDAWRAHYRRYFKYAARALGLGFVFGFAYFTLWPAQEKKALEFVAKALGDIHLDKPPLALALSLFYHNARASLTAVIGGVVPFLFLPILDPLANGAVLGLLSSISKHQGLNVPLLILTQVLPHGVFELPAVLYATSVGLYLSESLGKRALAFWRRKKSLWRGQPPPALEAANFLEAYAERPEVEDESLAGSVFRSFVLVVLPLLLVAAFIESFITPLLG